MKPFITAGVLLQLILWNTGCDTVQESPDQVPEDVTSTEETDSEPPVSTEPDFETMTSSQIERLAREVPMEVSGCSDEGVIPCHVSFLDRPVCSTDGFIYSGEGVCDEGGPGYFCAPSSYDCRHDSTARCAQDGSGGWQFFSAPGTCIAGEIEPECVLEEELPVMACNDLVGTRFCDEDRQTILEVVEAGCVENVITTNENPETPAGCVAAATEQIATCGDSEICDDSQTIIYLMTDTDDDSHCRGPSIQFRSDAQCIEDPYPCGEGGYCEKKRELRPAATKLHRD